MSGFSRLLVLVSGATLIAAATVSVPGTWTLTQPGTSGVSAMQLSVTTSNKVIILDKVEHNPLKRSNGQFAWASEYDLTTNTVRALNPVSNTFCAGGARMSNGTLVNTGGDAPLIFGGAGEKDGFQAIRLFDACDDNKCDIIENPTRLRMSSRRWYPTATRLDDGSVIIFGGSTQEEYINSASVNNPSYEFWPPKNINGHNGTSIPSQFLVDTLNGNLFAHMFVLPDTTLFVVANLDAMILNWRTNTETRLPKMPNGIRVTYPFNSAGVLLPLSYADNFTPSFLTCGGSNVSDTADPKTYSSKTPASDQCSRMTLNSAGIAAGWATERMPGARIMGDGLLLPDGRVLIINGAATGVAGYGAVSNQVGASDADNPVLQAIIYDPLAPAGSRFSNAGLPNSTIPRMYHSSATLLPDGRIMIAGSNPNQDSSTNKYQTEYRVEFLSPPYLAKTRPTISAVPAKISYGATFSLNVTVPANTNVTQVALLDLGFVTHGVHMDQRLIFLNTTLSSDGRSVQAVAPPNTGVYPPGTGWLYLVTDGVPSVGLQTMVGSGASPPVDHGALANLLSTGTHKSGATPSGQD